jgi:outer membrane protein OmpA-like peptidoglycan-associated protein
MRACSALVLVVSLFVPVVASAEIGLPAPILAAPTTKLQVTIDRAKVDLAGHQLEVKLSHPADKVKLKVFGESGAVLADVEKPFQGAAAGTTLLVSWTPASEEAVAKIEVWGYDTDGFFSGVAITPWNVTVAHEEVNFETASDVIRPTEVPKLEASVAVIKASVKKHNELGKITLYIIGHTDSVGSAESNLELSRKRARSIGGWFKAHGVAMAIAYEGMGESAPLVKTADEVDEPKNRRVDYILALEPPTAKSGTIAWKPL